MARAAQQRWRHPVTVLALVATGVVGCGGGGEDEGSGSGTGGYVNWNNSTNGAVVVDADNEEFRVVSDSRQIEDRSGKQARGMTVDSDARVFVEGRQVGVVQLVDGSNGTKIAAFRCLNGSAMDITFQADNTYSYACAAPASGGSTGAGAATGTGGADSTGYLTFQGNGNGTVVLDSDDERFQVAAATRTVVDRSGVRLSGLVVDSGGNVLRNGVTIGAVTLASGTGGSPVAVFSCNNGSRMNLTVGVQGWGQTCASDSTGAGNQAGGSTGGSSGGQSRSFITWTGSANGEVVLDASNDPFKFNSATRCLYSVNRDMEYGNFCLASGSASISFGGTTYSVTRLLSTSNTCIVGLTTADGYKADIVTDATRIDNIRATTDRPVAC